MGIQPRIDGLLSELVSDQSPLRAALRGALEKAYERGAVDMRDSIMQAATSSLPTSSREPQSEATPVVEEPKVETASTPVKERRSEPSVEKAPRGAVEAALNIAMVEEPGLIIAEYEKRVATLDPRISRKSVGNTLRRFEGEKYTRVDDKWFLKDWEPKPARTELSWPKENENASLAS